MPVPATKALYSLATFVMIFSSAALCFPVAAEEPAKLEIRLGQLEKQLAAQEKELLELQNLLQELQAQQRQLLGVQAGAALMESEVLVWSLEGGALREAQAILASAPAKQLLSDSTLSEAEQDKQLRALLRGQHSPALVREAKRFIGGLNARSRQWLQMEAERLAIRSEDLLLEWVTYEAALDFAMMTQIWKQQGNFTGEAALALTSLLDSVASPPTVESGVEVETRLTNHLEINLFGTRVVEELLPEHPVHVSPTEVTIRWRSNYIFLREVLNGKTAAAVIEETLNREDGRFTVDYLDWFQDYLNAGHQQFWAVRMATESALAVASSARDAEVRAKLGQNPQSHPRRSLRDLYSLLSPAVPVVECAGTGRFGSGFLLEYEGKLLVATNRHVIEDSPNGILVTFFKGAPEQPLKMLSVSANQTVVVAIHRTADLALVDVSKAAKSIREWELPVMQLAPPDHIPAVGDHVFAIGHPAAGEGVMFRTLSDGILSGVRPHATEQCRYLQVTVPINPGNSGGPLFDDAGQVVGINSFIIRKSQGENLALEALNFALEIRCVHDLLSDTAFAMDANEMKAVLNPQQVILEALIPRQEPVVNAFLTKGFLPFSGKLESSTRAVKLQSGGRYSVHIELHNQKIYGVGLVSRGTEDVDVAVVNDDGTIIAADTSVGPDSRLVFHVRAAGKYSLLVSNPTQKAADVVMTVFEMSDPTAPLPVPKDPPPMQQSGN